MKTHTYAKQDLANWVKDKEVQRTTAAAAPEAPQSTYPQDQRGWLRSIPPAQHSPLPVIRLFAIGISKDGQMQFTKQWEAVTDTDKARKYHPTGVVYEVIYRPLANPQVKQSELERVKAERDELLAALKDLRNAADNCLPCKGDGILNASIAKAEAAITNAEKP